MSVDASFDMLNRGGERQFKKNKIKIELFFKSNWNTILGSINLFVFNIYEINIPDVILHTFLPNFVTGWLIVLVIAKPITTTILVTKETCTQVC